MEAASSCWGYVLGGTRIMGFVCSLLLIAEAAITFTYSKGITGDQCAFSLTVYLSWLTLAGLNTIKSSRSLTFHVQMCLSS